MDATRFDLWIRTLATLSSRRQMLGALFMGGVASRFTGQEAAAGPGCKNAGKKCSKKKDCCSGVCKGKKGRKKCRAHDTGGCAPGGTCHDGAECTTSSGELGMCLTTTGNAPYCAADSAGCVPCTKDADCRAVCGPGAACMICEGECPATGGANCVGPSGNACV